MKVYRGEQLEFEAAFLTQFINKHHPLTTEELDEMHKKLFERVKPEIGIAFNRAHFVQNPIISFYLSYVFRYVTAMLKPEAIARQLIEITLYNCREEYDREREKTLRLMEAAEKTELNPN